MCVPDSFHSSHFQTTDNEPRNPTRRINVDHNCNRPNSTPLTMGQENIKNIPRSTPQHSHQIQTSFHDTKSFNPPYPLHLSRRTFRRPSRTHGSLFPSKASRIPRNRRASGPLRVSIKIRIVASYLILGLGGAWGCTAVCVYDGN